MSKREIRQLHPAELEEALALVWDVFSEFEAPGYSQEGIDEFWRFIDLEYMTMQIGEGSMTFWGAFEDDFLVGVCAFRGLDHVSLLFVDAEHHRQGMATAMLKKALLDSKRLDPDLAVITVNSSPYAVPFYKAVGFVPTGPEQVEDGLIFTPMKLDSLQEDKI